MPQNNMRDREQEARVYGKIVFKLKDVFRALGKTPKDIAVATESNPVIVKRAYNGATIPSYELLARICSVYNLRIEDLIEYQKPD